VFAWNLGQPSRESHAPHLVCLGGHARYEWLRTGFGHVAGMNCIDITCTTLKSLVPDGREVLRSRFVALRELSPTGSGLRIAFFAVARSCADRAARYRQVNERS
jgi:hypothetical protein